MALSTIQKIDRLSVDSDLLHAVVHGGVAQTVTTEGGDIPSAANAVNTLKAYNIRGMWASGMTLVIKDVFINNGIAYVVLSPGPYVSTDVAADLAAGRIGVHQGATREELAAAGGSSLVGFQQAGGGVRARPMQDKAQEIISVTDWTFVAGSYAAAIKRAIAETANLKNAILTIPMRGTFQLEDQIALGVDTGLVGAGQLSTILTWAGAGPAIYYRPAVFNPYGAAIRHLSVNGLPGGVGGGIELSDTFGFILEDVGVAGFTGGDGVTLRNINKWTEGTEFHGVRVGNCKRQLVMKRDPAPATATGSFGYVKMLSASFQINDGQQGIVVGDDAYSTTDHHLYNSLLNCNMWQQGNSQGWVFGKNATVSDSWGLNAGEVDSTFTGVYMPPNTLTSGLRNADMFTRSSPLGKPENQYSQFRDLRYKKFRDIGSKAAGTGTTPQWFQIAQLGATKGIFMGSLYTQSGYGSSSYVSAAVQFAFGNPGSGVGGYAPVFQVSGDAFELGNSNNGQPHFKIATDAAGNVSLYFRRPAFADVCQFDYSYDWETGATVELWVPTSDPSTIPGLAVVWDSYNGVVQQARNGDELLAAQQRIVVATNGSTLVYSFGHNYTDNAGNPVAPEFYSVEAVNADANTAGISNVAVTATSVVITMKAKTPSGTGNVLFGITLGRKAFWKAARPS
ncbi:hypothetical protein P0D75_34790 [Paraburkholderia sediminicola]|uniref:hypothetical protein n=1 Tax=Paraburkholderia sediminicola TaxID=458836 RepID=UPI0038B82938